MAQSWFVCISWARALWKMSQHYCFMGHIFFFCFFLLSLGDISITHWINKSCAYNNCTANVEICDAQISSVYGRSVCEQSALFLSVMVMFSEQVEEKMVLVRAIYSPGSYFKVCWSLSDLWPNKWWLLSWRWSYILHHAIRSFTVEDTPQQWWRKQRIIHRNYS